MNPDPDLGKAESSKNTAASMKRNNIWHRQDVIVWFFGIVFILVVLACMWAWGIGKDWHAISGYFYEDFNTTIDRFLPEPYGCNETDILGRSGNGCTGKWYFWKLKPEDLTVWKTAFVWLLYSLHQIFMWGLIYRAQLTMSLQNKTKDEKYSSNLNWFNWSLLGVNALFHVLHLIQTHLSYDATAQNVSISSSQSSVIMMMVFIMVIEYKQRGLFLMWPNPKSNDVIAKRVRLNSRPIELVRKYHGYCFSWAVIYTFWYHPMENTWGHTLGFFHTAIVMLQGSLIFTKMHLNRYWRLLNESWVLIHATIIAFQTGNPSLEHRSDLWPMFFMGFAFMFCFTQIFTLPFWSRAYKWTRIIPGVVFFVVVIALCATVIPGKTEGQSGFSRIYEMVFIPAELYISFLFAWAVIYFFLFVEAKTSNSTNNQPPASPTKQAAYLCLCVLVYAMFILISYLVKQSQTMLELTALMIILVFVFIFGCCITFMLLKQLIPDFEPTSNINKQISKVSVIPASSSGNLNEAYEMQ